MPHSMKRSFVINTAHKMNRYIVNPCRWNSSICQLCSHLLHVIDFGDGHDRCGSKSNNEFEDLFLPSKNMVGIKSCSFSFSSSFL